MDLLEDLEMLREKVRMDVGACVFPNSSYLNDYMKTWSKQMVYPTTILLSQAFSVDLRLNLKYLIQGSQQN